MRLKPFLPRPPTPFGFFALDPFVDFGKGPTDAIRPEVDAAREPASALQAPDVHAAVRDQLAPLFGGDYTVRGS